MSAPSRDAWLAAHPYLSHVGEVDERIGAALARVPIPKAAAPTWEDYRPDFVEGVPVLESARTGVDLEPAGAVTIALVDRLAAEPGTGALADSLPALARELRGLDDAPRRVATWLLGGEGLAPTAPGVLQYLGWASAERYLRPVRASFQAWRDEEKWLQPYCPICGSGPAMAQLSGTDPGRMRRLVCGRCLSRWQFRRTQCPFCENDAQRLATLAVEGESGLRIDHCESCRGYLKTYDGEGKEDVLLADWTSLHLDLLAQDRGLVKRAASLFALDVPLSDGVTRVGATRTEA